MVPLTDPRHYHAGLQSATLQNVSVRWLSHQHSNEMIPPNYLCIHNLLFNVCLFLLKIINTIEQSPRHQSLNKGHCYYYYLYSISIWLIPITLKTYFCLSPVIRHPQRGNIWLSSFCAKSTVLQALTLEELASESRQCWLQRGIIRQTSADDGNLIGKGKVHRLFSSTFVTLGSLVSLMGCRAHLSLWLKLAQMGSRKGCVFCFVSRSRRLFLSLCS